MGSPLVIDGFRSLSQENLSDPTGLIKKILGLQVDATPRRGWAHPLTGSAHPVPVGLFTRR